MLRGRAESSILLVNLRTLLTVQNKLSQPRHQFQEKSDHPALKKLKPWHLGQFKEVPSLEIATQNMTNGFFIEVGALNGVRLSNTLYFEAFKNWTGEQN